jgi:hypothetical protein
MAVTSSSPSRFESGEVEGVDVSGLTVAAVGDMEVSHDDGVHRIRVGDDGEVEVQEIVPFGKEDGQPASLVGIFHPAGEHFAIAKATKSNVSAFGIEFAYEGRSGFASPFAWAA